MPTSKLTTEDFKERIFDYSTKEEWNFKGDKPVVIDFYADWCGPCKAIAPVLEELSEDFKDKVNIYKVDTEAEEELSAVFGIQSIPTLLFIPLDGPPMMQKGALPKNIMEKIILEELLNEKSAD